MKKGKKAQASGKKTVMETLTEPLIKFLEKIPSSIKILLLILVFAGILVFSVWSTLPDSYQQKIIKWLTEPAENTSAMSGDRNNEFVSPDNGIRRGNPSGDTNQPEAPTRIPINNILNDELNDELRNRLIEADQWLAGQTRNCIPEALRCYEFVIGRLTPQALAQLDQRLLNEARLHIQQRSLDTAVFRYQRLFSPYILQNNF